MAWGDGKVITRKKCRYACVPLGLQKPFFRPKKAFNGVISDVHAAGNHKFIAFLLFPRRTRGLSAI